MGLEEKPFFSEHVCLGVGSWVGSMTSAGSGHRGSSLPGGVRSDLGPGPTTSIFGVAYGCTEGLSPSHRDLSSERDAMDAAVESLSP
jgi:hypothetical protein